MNEREVRQVLQQVEQHIADGETHIASQRRIVAELERHGHGVQESRELLATFEELQVQHIDHRDRLIAKLATFQK